MMMDGPGCGIIAGILALIGLFIGLILHWVGLIPWWGVLVGAALPLGLIAILFFYLIARWMASGSH